MPMDYDALKNKLARRTNNGWTPKEGDNLLRLFPHTARYFSEQLGDFAIEFRSHFLKATGMDTIAVRCLRDRGDPCPLCEAFHKFKDSSDPVIKKAAQDVRSGERHLMNILNLNDPTAGIQSYESGPQVYNEFLAYIANPAWGDVLNPMEGRNFVLNLTPSNKSGTGYNQYRVQPYPDKTNIVPHLPQGWQDKLESLASGVCDYPDPATIEKWLRVMGLSSALGGPVVAPLAAYGAPPPVAAPFAPPPMPAPQPIGFAPPPPPPPPPPPMAIPVAAPVIPQQPPSYTPASTPPVAAPSVAAPSVAAPVQGAAPDSPAAQFAVKVGRQAVRKAVDRAGTMDNVPDCYSEGPDNKALGYNPAQFPCEHGCPVKPNCQLRSLGLK